MPRIRASGFLPSIGRLDAFKLEDAVWGGRVDTGFDAGDHVEPALRSDARQADRP